MSQLAAARKQYPHLNDYTDQELLGIIAQQNNITPDSPMYKRIQDEVFGYKRSVGEAVKDAVVGLGQGIVSVARGLNTGMHATLSDSVNASGARHAELMRSMGAAPETVAEVVKPMGTAYDNASGKQMEAVTQVLEAKKSTGLKNRMAGDTVAMNIAQAESKARGDGAVGSIISGLGGKMGSYVDNPQLLAQDAITTLPQMIGPGAAGRVVQNAAVAAGAGLKGAGRAGLGAAVGTGGAMQGADVGNETYQRAIKEGATPKQATRLANTASAKSALATVALSLTPLGGTIERSMLGGATVGRGLGQIGGRVVAGVGEAVSEGIEEGYGKFAGNQAIKELNADTDLYQGVGEAAAQGAAAGGLMGGVMARPGAARTEAGEIDLIAPSRVDPALDTPARAPRTGPVATGEGTVMVTPDGTALPAQSPEQMARLEEMRRFNEGIPTLTDEIAPADGIPVLNERLDEPVLTDVLAPADGIPVLTDRVEGMPEVPTLTDTLAPADGIPVLTDEVENPARPNKGKLLTSLQETNKELGKTFIKKDGGLAGNRAAAPLREVLEAKDPLGKLRELHQDGSAPRDELLDTWHKKLTGQTVFDWKAAQTPALNDVGFAPEPAAQVVQQVDDATGQVIMEELATEADLPNVQQPGTTADLVSPEQERVDRQASPTATDLLRTATRESRIRGMEGERVPDPVAAEIMRARGVKQLDDELQARGILLRGIIGAGAGSVVLDAGDKVVRLGTGKASAVPSIAGVLQPMESGNIDGIRFDIMPKAVTNGITQEDVAEVAAKVAAQGYEFSDAGIDNVGRVNGEAVIIDPGAVTKSKQALTGQQETRVKEADPYTYTKVGKYIVIQQSSEDTEVTVRARTDDGLAEGDVFPDMDSAMRYAKANQHIEPKRSSDGYVTNYDTLTGIDRDTKAKAEKGSKKSGSLKYGRKPTDELIDISDNTKDEAEFEQARYELYKRWAEGDEKADAYLTDGFDVSTGKGLKRFLDRPEIKAFKLRHDAELKEKGAKKGAKLGEKFGAKFRSNGKTGAVTAAQAQDIADAVTRGWTNAPEIEVVTSMDDLPAAILKQAVLDGATNVRGAYADGKVWVVAENHATPGDVVATVLHEVAGHHGLRGLLGAEFGATMRAIYNGNTAMRQAADTRGGDVELAIEEILAESAESGKVAPTAVEKIGNAIRKIMRNVGLGRFAAGITNAEVKELIAEARGFVKSGASTETQGPTAYRQGGLQFMSDAANTMRAGVQAQTSGKEISPKLLSVMTLRQIAEQFGDKLPAMRPWIAAIMERSTNASKLAAEADRVALEWEQGVKDPAERAALAEVFLRASVAELELDNVTQKYLSELSPEQRAEHAALRAKLETLSPESQRARKQALAILKRQWEYTRESLESFINHTVSDPGLRSARIEQLKKELGRNRGDYFPLSRFGARIVVARNAASDGRDIVSFHETAAAAEAEVAKWHAAGKKVTVNLKSEYDRTERAAPGFIGEIHKMIDGADTDPTVKDSMHEALQQLFLKSMPELAGAKAMIRRENIEGFSRDALRAFADSVTRGSRYASQLEFAPAIQAAREAAEAQSRSSESRVAAVVIGRKEGEKPVVVVVPAGTERLNAVNRLTEQGYATEFSNKSPETVKEYLAGALEGVSDEQINAYAAEVEAVVGRTSTGVEDLRAAKALYNHMIKLQQSEKNEDAGAVLQALGQVGYVWYLGLSPAFWAMNTLQNPMIGIPHLGAKYGAGATAAEWGATAKWFAGVRIGKRWGKDKTPFSVEWLKEEAKAGKLTGITKDELDMLQDLQDRQVLDFTQSMDLNRISQASGSTVYKAMRFVAAGAHHTEVFNRVTFALSAYRLALKSDSSVTHAQAVSRAESDTAAVHFDYSFANKPALMRGKVSRLMFMFQQYRQHMLYWWVNNTLDSVKGESKEVRQQARKAMLLMGATQGVFAGAMGLPFVGSIAFLANLLVSDDDDGVPFDFNRWILEAATDTMGKEAGEVFAKGIFAAVGMNISQRIGQADLMPLLNQSSAAKYERNTDDKVRAFAYELAGPLGSLALTAARGLDAFERGDTLTGLATVAPKFIGDLLKAGDLASEGAKNSRGELLATAEAFDGWDVAMQAAGVVPTAVANIKADGAKVRSMEAAITKRTRELTGQFVEAWSRGDQEGLTTALAGIQTFNGAIAAKYKDPALLIDRRQLESAIKDRQNSALFLAVSGGTAESKRQLQMAQRASGLFNPVTPESIRQKAAGLR